MDQSARKPAARLILVAVVASTSWMSAGCGKDEMRAAQIQSIGGDPQRGREALYRYGCGSCHAVAGVSGATGKVGPPLDGVGERWYIAGMLPNTPANMMRWIRDPQLVNPKTAMPNMDVSEQDARDITTYLYTSAK